MIIYGLCGIYQIKNKVNGYRYIGSSVDIRRRWNAHKSRLNRGVHCNEILQRIWDKYGEDILEFKILMLCKKEDVLKYEQAFLDKVNPEYNIAKDVTAPLLGRTHSAEACRKISEANTGKNHPQYGRPGTMLVKTHLEETKNKISIARLGYKHTEDAKLKMSTSRAGENNHMYGKRHSEDALLKMSEVKSGSSNPMYEKEHSEDTKRKMSEARRLWWARKRGEQ